VDDDIEIKKVSGGYSCNTYCVHSSEPDDAIIIRVRKMLAKASWLDPKFEETVVQELSRIGIFSKVYAFFQNGYCYRYIEGKPLANLTDPSEASPDELPLEQIAQMLARVHNVKINGSDYSKSTTFSMIDRVLANEYPADSDIADKEVLTREINELFAYGKKFDLNIGLTHGDLNPGNIVWDSIQKTLTFVDWEGEHIGYQALDVAYFLQMLQLQEILPVPGIIQVSAEKIEEKRRHFIKAYLETLSKLQDIGGSVSEDDFQKLYHEVIYISLIWPLYCVILMTANMGKAEIKDFPTDPTSMLKNTMEYYFKTKEAKLSQLKKAGFI